MIQEPVLLALANDIEASDRRLANRVSARLDVVVNAVPDALLLDPLIAHDFPSPDRARDRYREYLVTRLEAPRAFVLQALQAREVRLQQPIKRRQARR